MTTLLLAFALAWKFVSPDESPVVAMEWKRVLNSPVSAELRKEIPKTAAPVLSRMNFIEGIERIIWTPRLVVVEGVYDTEQLRASAMADGGTLTRCREFDLIIPIDKSNPAIAIAPTILLFGKGEALRAIIDAARNSSAEDPTAGYDLWVRSTAPGIKRHDFGVRLQDGIRIQSDLTYESEELRGIASTNASELSLNAAFPAETSLQLTGAIALSRYGGRQWRTAIETLHTRAVPKPKSPGVIRIYGLDEGVKEISLK